MVPGTPAARGEGLVSLGRTASRGKARRDGRALWSCYLLSAFFSCATFQSAMTFFASGSVSDFHS